MGRCPPRLRQAQPTRTWRARTLPELVAGSPRLRQAQPTQPLPELVAGSPRLRQAQPTCMLPELVAGSPRLPVVRVKQCLRLCVALFDVRVALLRPYCHPVAALLCPCADTMPSSPRKIAARSLRVRLRWLDHATTTTFVTPKHRTQHTVHFTLWIKGAGQAANQRKDRRRRACGSHGRPRAGRAIRRTTNPRAV